MRHNPIGRQFGHPETFFNKETSARVERPSLEASAALEARMHYPLGVQSEPFRDDIARSLLESPVTWTESSAAFLKRHLFEGNKEGVRESELREIAKSEYYNSYPDGGEFPLRDYQDFINIAYRCGLIERDYRAPGGDPHSRDRVIYLRLSSFDAEDLVIAYSPKAQAEIEEQKASGESVLNTEEARSISSILGILQNRGSVEFVDLFDELSSGMSPESSELFYPYLKGLMEKLVKLGQLTQYEDSLGGEYFRAA